MRSQKRLFRMIAMVAAMTFMMAIALGGCSSQQRPKDTEPLNNAPSNPTVPGQMSNNNDTTTPIEGTYDKQKVSAAEDAVDKLTGVEDASVVMSKDTAWVALEYEDGYMPGGSDLNNSTPPPSTTPPSTASGSTASQTAPKGGTGTTASGTEPMNTPGMNNPQMMVPESLKLEISKVIQDMYPEIKNVYVTADETLGDQLERIGEDLSSGKTFKDIGNDLRDIGDRIMGR